MSTQPAKRRPVMDVNPPRAAGGDLPFQPVEDLSACLPADLRSLTPGISRIATSFSGAGVYRVDTSRQAFVLKISGEGESQAAWHRRLQIQQLAAGVGLAPPIVHVDEARRAVVSAFVVDRSFPAYYLDSRTHEEAVAHVGRTVRRAHELPMPSDADFQDPRESLAVLWSTLAERLALPAFVGEAVRDVLEEEAPPRERALVLSHNDVHPMNLIYDGENIMLVDWDTVGPNDPFYDLATISVFLLMNEETCRKLLTAYDGEPISGIPARFAYSRRLVSALCGMTFLRFAHDSGYAGDTVGETLASTPSLAEFYQRMRSGSLNPATGEGQWWFGLALVKASVALSGQ